MKCKEVSDFFNQVSSRTISSMPGQADLDLLKKNNLINLYTKDEYNQLANDVSQIQSLQKTVGDEKNSLYTMRSNYNQDYKETHSFLFHLEGREKKEAEDKKMEQDVDALKNEEEKLTADEGKIADLIRKKSILDGLTQSGDYYISLTNQGKLMSSSLSIRMYRASDMEFGDFLSQQSSMNSQLITIANEAFKHFRSLSASLQDADPSHIWSTAVGLAKIQGDTQTLDSKFVKSYSLMEKLTKNKDNAMMAAEIIASSSEEPDNAFGSISELNHGVRHQAHVDKEASVGIAAILYFGRAFDGTYPLQKLLDYKRITRSDESAAIMAIVNKQEEEITGKFNAMKSIFSSWGYTYSEDTEMSSAYLAISDLPEEGFETKLGIIINGIKSYLEYPLVASSILASIPVMEANETLDLVEQAYSIIGRVATGLSQSELIGLAVRAIHGIRNEIVRNLDTTAKLANTPVQLTYRPMGFGMGMMWMPIFVPLIVVHSSYYSTFSSIGGVHPGHVHVSGGMQG